MIADRRPPWPLAHALDVGIVHGLVGVFLQPGLAAHQADGGAVIDRELALQPALMFCLVAEIEHQRRDAQPHGGESRGLELMLVVKLNAAVDGRVVHDAAGERLVGVLAQIEVDAEPRRDLRQVVRARPARREAARAFDAVLAGGEARCASSAAA